MITRLICQKFENIPEQIQPGILYISDKYKTAIHLCPCGCGEETVTPIHPINGWILEFYNGKATLTPSIGNRFACKSHYFIRNNEIVWA